jgi:hypothetical protein
MVTAIMIAILIVSGCSKAVVIPREEVAAETYRQPGTYRIRLEGWNEYNARRFAVTDSTVIIEELLKSDDRYKLMKHDMPIVIPIGEVTSIARMETNRPVTIAVIAGLGLAAAYMTWVAIALAGLSATN